MARFNAEQTANRQQFAVYFEEAHGRPYIFAEQELQAALAPPPMPVAQPVQVQASRLGMLGG